MLHNAAKALDERVFQQNRPKADIYELPYLAVMRANFENARKTLWTEHELRAAKLAPERTLY
jgi:hypothetical protein